MDGRELAKKTTKHTIPLMVSIDETFDVGLEIRTGVAHEMTLVRGVPLVSKLTHPETGEGGSRRMIESRPSIFGTHDGDGML